VLAVLLGSLSAFGYGAADFLGGLAAKRMMAMLVTAVAALAGAVALLFAAPIDGGVWYFDTTMWGAVTGVTSCLGIWLLYSAYARGPMTTLAPVVAIVSTVVPMAAGLLSGETFSPLGWAALVTGLVAIALVARPRSEGHTRARTVDVVKAAIAGAFLGVLYIFLDSAPLDSGLTPLTANRIACAVLAFVVVGFLTMRAQRAAADSASASTAARSAVGGTLTQTAPATRTALNSRARGVLVAGAAVMAMTSGLLDASANTLFLIALGFADLSLLSVVTGFYPAVTILLALVILKERPSALQTVGIILALLALGGMSFA
jgi:drug/metabolite transporter (DMT)-like permease